MDGKREVEPTRDSAGRSFPYLDEANRHQIILHDGKTSASFLALPLESTGGDLQVSG